MTLQIILTIYFIVTYSYSFNYRRYLEEIDMDICKKIIKPRFNEGDLLLTEMFGYSGVLYHTFVMMESKEFEGYIIGSVLKDHFGPRLLRLNHKTKLYEKEYNWTFAETLMLLELRGTIEHLWTDIEYVWKTRYIYNSQEDPWEVKNLTLSYIYAYYDEQTTTKLDIPEYGWRQAKGKKGVAVSSVAVY